MGEVIRLSVWVDADDQPYAVGEDAPMFGGGAISWFHGSGIIVMATSELMYLELSQLTIYLFLYQASR